MKRTWRQTTTEMVKNFVNTSSYERIRKAERTTSDRCFDLASKIFKLENFYCFQATRATDPDRLTKIINDLKRDLRQANEFRQIMLAEMKIRCTPIESNEIRRAMRF